MSKFDFDFLGKLNKCIVNRLTSNRSDRGIFCWATGTACCTTGPKGDCTVDGSGPNIVGTKCPCGKYGLYELAGIPVK